MNQLTELLQHLSEIEPEVCRLEPEPPDEIYYKIGGYVFFFIDGEFSAGHKDHIGRTQYYTGPPALAWLRDAVEWECERRGWTLATTSAAGISRTVSIGTFDKGAIGNGYSKDDLTTALLAAFVAACEAAALANR